MIVVLLLGQSRLNKYGMTLDMHSCNGVKLARISSVLLRHSMLASV